MLVGVLVQLNVALSIGALCVFIFYNLGALIYKFFILFFLLLLCSLRRLTRLKVGPALVEFQKQQL